MKTAVVYYSLEGHTKNIVQQIQEKYPVDCLELQEEKRPSKTNFLTKVFWGGRQILVASSIKPYTFTPEEYQTIIIGTPVWAWTFVPALKDFFKNYASRIQNKKIILFANHEGGPREVIQNLTQALPNNTVVFSALFNQSKKLKEQTEKEIQDFIEQLKNYLV